jgi:hypothetical protein
VTAKFPLGANTVVDGRGEAAPAAAFLARTLNLKSGSRSPSRIRLVLVSEKLIGGEGAHRLTVTRDQVLIHASLVWHAKFESQADQSGKLGGINPAHRRPGIIPRISLAFSKSAVLISSTKGSHFFSSCCAIFPRSADRPDSGRLAAFLMELLFRFIDGCQQVVKTWGALYRPQARERGAEAVQILLRQQSHCDDASWGHWRQFPNMG